MNYETRAGPSREPDDTCRRYKILLADDEPDIVLVTKTRLELNGYVLETAYDGIEALGKVRTFRPDLILLDLKMPKLDGFQLCKRLKADPEFRTIPILFFSASTAYSLCLEKQCLELGADGYIRKPFEVRQLLTRIRALLERPPALPLAGAAGTHVSVSGPALGAVVPSSVHNLES